MCPHKTTWIPSHINILFQLVTSQQHIYIYTLSSLIDRHSQQFENHWPIRSSVTEYFSMQAIIKHYLFIAGIQHKFSLEMIPLFCNI